VKILKVIAVMGIWSTFAAILCGVSDEIVFAIIGGTAATLGTMGLLS
jgi:hypothetical protein